MNKVRKPQSNAKGLKSPLKQLKSRPIEALIKTSQLTSNAQTLNNAEYNRRRIKPNSMELSHADGLSIAAP